MIIDGVITGNDEGLTARMPEALEEVRLKQAAEHVRTIILLCASAPTAKQDEANRNKALGHWLAIQELFDEWVPGGERVMLTRLYEWYPAQAGT